jgi:hypothetical protein
MTSRRAVWVAENATTLLSTRPTARAAAITSTSRSVAARPLRETTQIAPVGTIRSRSAASGSRSPGPSTARKTRSLASFG